MHVSKASYYKITSTKVINWIMQISFDLNQNQIRQREQPTTVSIPCDLISFHFKLILALESWKRRILQNNWDIIWSSGFQHAKPKYIKDVNADERTNLMRYCCVQYWLLCLYSEDNWSFNRRKGKLFIIIIINYLFYKEHYRTITTREYEGGRKC